ncbi:hypothetical protein JRI60_23450 [Archangium violaceum]|uniref:hypothetical protein n=1 Tax=Archangium violaceum TaxID=83451 RepID=UPI0019518B57|nr:hypothetical protein [Archangium violaceum]QRO01767.1 hypothetical protein JRI60_23450 [Archangium violaceum]
MIRMLLPLWLSLSLVACARSTAAQRGDAPVNMELKSSLSVLLDHRSELALDDDQVKRFGEMDLTLHEKNVLLQQRLEELRAQHKAAEKAWHGGYKGGGTHDIYGGKGGSSTAPGEAEDQQRRARSQRLEQMQSTLREMQDNDTRAYLEAEKLLREEQKPRARELFSQEREKLFERVEAMILQVRRKGF